MSLSTDDEFRLNVLLADTPQAIRIDESRLQVITLTARWQEHVLTLSPTCRDEQYLRMVRQLLAERYGFPGGFPAQLNRWSEMGQVRSSNLQNLLLLGEPEAVTAVSATDGISHQLARLAWWALPDADNARRLLAHPSVITGECGQLLVDHLMEYLPFETSASDICDSIRLLIRSGLVPESRLKSWWTKAQRSGAYMLGFLQAIPDSLPDQQQSTHPLLVRHDATLAKLAKDNNPLAALLQRLLSAAGQTYLRGCRIAVSRPEDQEIMNSVLDHLAEFFQSPATAEGVRGSPQEIQASIDALMQQPESHAQQLASVAPELTQHAQAAVYLSLVSYEFVRPVLANTTATGSLMRRKLSPITNELDARIAILLG